MYQRILVALDGSAVNEVVLPHAMAMARASGAEVRLLRVVPNARAAADLVVMPLADAGPGPVSLDAQSQVAEELEARRYLDALIARFGDAEGRVSAKVSFGPVASTIAAEAGTWHADLLLLATHGRGGLARLMLGSVAEAVLRGVQCPTLVVPVAAPPGEQAPTPLPGQVLSFEEDARKAGAVAPKPLGLRTVDVSRITGSVGRARELGPDFRPPTRAQRRGDDERFQSIVRAHERGVVLPPVELYKLGYNYYVLDGNHRVAAAKATNQRDIDAVVTEFLPISNEESATVFNERRDFERATGLTRIGASRVGHYPRLEEVVRAYARDPANRPSGYAGWEEGDLRAAARHWYYHVYDPVARAIRAAKLARCFPSERTADIFVHLANLRADLAQRTGTHLSWEEAFQRFAANYSDCAGTAWQRLPGLRKLLRPHVPVTRETR